MTRVWKYFRSTQGTTTTTSFGFGEEVDGEVQKRLGVWEESDGFNVLHFGKLVPACCQAGSVC